MFLEREGIIECCVEIGSEGNRSPSKFKMGQERGLQQLQKGSFIWSRLKTKLKLEKFTSRSDCSILKSGRGRGEQMINGGFGNKSRCVNIYIYWAFLKTTLE